MKYDVIHQNAMQQVSYIVKLSCGNVTKLIFGGPL